MNELEKRRYLDILLATMPQDDQEHVLDAAERLVEVVKSEASHNGQKAMFGSKSGLELVYELGRLMVKSCRSSGG